MEKARSSRVALLDRRRVLQRMCLGIAALPVIAACGDTDTGAGDPDAAEDPDAAVSPDAGSPDARSPDAGTSGSPDAAPTPDAATSADGWASGGTDAMTDRASYPDPFTEAATSCALVASTTEGPCTTATDLSREDVSDGWTGLPVRLALKVVDGSCDPVVGATVKIWHPHLEGIYSGQTPNPTMCSANNQTYIAMDFFRGVQTTGADGTVYFDTCFPGWYRGRAVHIHFQVKSGTTSYRISQLFFPEAVTSEIFSSHPEYRSYGQPDTTFANDNVAGAIGTATLPRHVLTVARMTDGAMLASKVVTVRS